MSDRFQIKSSRNTKSNKIARHQQSQGSDRSRYSDRRPNFNQTRNYSDRTNESLPLSRRLGPIVEDLSETESETQIKRITSHTNIEKLRDEALQIPTKESIVAPPSRENDCEFSLSGLKVDVNIGGKTLRAIVNLRRKASIINRTVIKLIKTKINPVNYDIIDVEITAGNRSLDIVCVTNYKLNVPIVLGRDAIKQFGFKLSIVPEDDGKRVDSIFSSETKCGTSNNHMESDEILHLDSDDNLEDLEDQSS